MQHRANCVDFRYVFIIIQNFESIKVFLTLIMINATKFF